MCFGHCATSPIDLEQRNRSIYCESVKKILSYYEKLLMSGDVTPISRHSRREDIERFIIDHYEDNNDITLEEALRRMDIQFPETVEAMPDS